MNRTLALMISAAMLGLGAQAAIAGENVGEKIFKKKCAMCHKIDKKKVGPAVKDMNRDPEVLRQTIAEGRKMMPRFGGKLSAEEIDAVVAFLQSKQKDED
ncbi:MAG: cytochrome c [Deltaproteobacteria bacterium]|nr:MAG: cytochrome c [Deltaproteobacteria bacterium]